MSLGHGGTGAAVEKTLTQPEVPLLLLCDLNETLVGDDAASACFKAAWEASWQPCGALLVYNTGRSLAATMRMLSDKHHCLPRPDALICTLGTRIYWPGLKGGSWEEDTAWTQRMAAGWSREQVMGACHLVIASGRVDLQLQSTDEFKVTCTVSRNKLVEAEQGVTQELGARSAHALIITSGQGDRRFLTLVPGGAGKLAAQEHVRKRFGVPHDRMISCGDSGNDLLMLAGPNAGVVVGNSEPDLIAWARQQQQDQPQQQTATGQHRLYVAEGHEALGVLEGLKHFGFQR